MKRIVILCDGTWNRSDSVTPTNVVRLAQTLESSDGHVAQVPIYVQGVGTGEGVTKGAKRLDQFLGGALGWGLLENLVEAYRHLVFLYEPGDEIYIFGFSRGAYTARPLTGFIRSTGIVGRDDLALIPQAVERYRTREDEVAWREAHRRPGVPLLKIAYLGVRDSVGALGSPQHIPIIGKMTARKHQFHDAALSSMVGSARHAVALDERRRTFEPTRWTNVDRLNEGRRGDGAEAPYPELFFAGDHGSVGGGGDVTKLSSIGLRWIIEGAQAVGLRFDDARMRELRAEEDRFGPLRNTSEAPTGIMNWLRRRNPKDREGPKTLAELHPAVIDRLTLQAKKVDRLVPYRPGSLRHLEVQIAALQSEDGADPSGGAHGVA